MRYLLFLQNIRLCLDGAFDGFFLALTHLAESPLPFLFLAFIYWCADKRWGQLMALNTGFSCFVGQAAKGIFRVDRPWVMDARIHPVEEALGGAFGYSFPSGHTIRAGGAYGVSGLELLRRKSKKAGIAFVSLFLLIAFSRNYLGVHTMKDVIAGMVLCALNYTVLLGVLSWMERGRGRDVLVCAVFCLLAFLPMLFLGCLPNAGACFGFFGGWLVERHFVGFAVPETQSEKIVRGLPGLLGVLLIAEVFQKELAVLMAARYAQFFTGFFLSLFIMALYPAIFSRPLGKLRRMLAAILTAVLFLLPFALRYAQQRCEGSGREVAVIGHRGFAAAAPENTMPAFEAALALGVDYIELDVQLSADREIVVCHDANLQRVTGEDVELSSLTLTELKGLDFGVWFSPEYAGTQIPTLREVLTLIRESDVRVYLELKDIGEDTAFPGEVLALTQELDMEERCVFASFQYAYLQQIKARDPKAMVLLNTGIGETTLPVEYPADYFGVEYSSFSAALAQVIHDSGAVAFVWTVDDPQQMADAVVCGADGICSNRPDAVLAYLRGQ